MTPAQHQLLTFIASYQDAHDGITPSYDEMAAGINKAKSNVYRLLDLLEAEGRIDRPKLAGGYAVARSIVLKGQLNHVSDAELLVEIARRHPKMKVAVA